MVNDAMFPPDKDELNDFTRFIFERKEYTLVKARNGRIFEVLKKEPEEQDEEPSFMDKELFCWWYADGSSCKSHEYDLVEIVGHKKSLKTYLENQL